MKNVNTNPQRGPEDGSAGINEKARILIRALDALLEDEGEKDAEKVRLDELKSVAIELFGLGDAGEGAAADEKPAKDLKSVGFFVTVRPSLKQQIDDFAYEHRISKANLIEGAFRFYRGAHERGLVDVADLK